MRLNAKGIGQSHVLKLQMALKKSVSETGALAYKFQITAPFSVQKVVLFPKYALNFASIFFKLSLSGNFLAVKPLF